METCNIGSVIETYLDLEWECDFDCLLELDGDLEYFLLLEWE